MKKAIKILNKKAIMETGENEFMACDAKCSEDRPCSDMVLPCKTSDVCPFECEIPFCGSRDIKWSLAWTKSF